jgi:hypothetical protein
MRKVFSYGTLLVASITIFNALFFGACGPSQVELDAAAASARQQLLQDQADAQWQQELKTEMGRLKGRLEAEETKLGDIKQFKLLRTGEEKAQDIEAKVPVIEGIKLQISETEQQIR